MTSKLKGKMVKDYTFGDTLIVYDEGLELSRATK